MLGVFDGHGGSSCAQVIAKRLMSYISACLLPSNILKTFLDSMISGNHPQLLETFNDKARFINEINKVYEESFVNFLKDLAENNGKDFQMDTALENAFLRLDNDISIEAVNAQGKNVERTLSVAMSGAVAAVAHIDGPHLHVANVGDCQVVIGVLSGIFFKKYLTSFPLSSENQKLFFQKMMDGQQK